MDNHSIAKAKLYEVLNVVDSLTFFTVENEIMAEVQENIALSFVIEPGTTVESIPDQLQKQITSQATGTDRYGNPTFFIDAVRVSTAICFHDNDSIALWGRPEKLQTNRNDVYDVFGSVAYNNPSLPHKLTESYLKSQVLSARTCPAFAIEKSVGDETGCIMSVTNIGVSSESLKLIATEDIHIMTIVDALNIPSEKLSSKAQVALSQLSLSQ